MPGTLPATKRPTQATLRSLTQTRVSVAHSLQRQVRATNAQRWAWDLIYPPLTRDESAELHAFLLRQRGQGETFSFAAFPPHDTPRGAATGSPAVQHRENLLTQSAALDHANWTKTRISVTPNVVAFEGAAIGDKLVEDTSNDTHVLDRNLAAAPNAPYSMGVVLQASERTTAVVQLRDVTNAANLAVTNINLATGALSATSGIVARDDLGGGWWRVGLSGTTAGNTATIAPRVLLHDGASVSYLGDGSSGLYAVAAQMNRGLALHAYNAAGAAANLPIAVSGTAIYTDGWTPATGNIMRAGDLLKFANHDKVYSVVQDANSDAFGNSLLTIEPPLVADPADDDALTVSSVPFVMALLSDEVGLNMQPASTAVGGALYGISLQLVEAP